MPRPSLTRRTSTATTRQVARRDRRRRRADRDLLARIETLPTHVRDELLDMASSRAS